MDASRLAPSSPTVVTNRLELAWFAALCDDDFEQLGVPNPDLVSSFEHCCSAGRPGGRLACSGWSPAAVLFLNGSRCSIATGGPFDFVDLSPRIGNGISVVHDGVDVVGRTAEQRAAQ